MPGIWKVGMVILVLCLLASMVIAIYRLSTTPTEILGAGFRDLPPAEIESYEKEAAAR
ncbi:MAG: hypothetical protein R2725_05570 [Solirubrobacterales bacterium]